MTNQPTPRRMKANPHTKWGAKHRVEHEENCRCSEYPQCLPVDAPPRRMKANPSQCSLLHRSEHSENWNCATFGCLPVDAPVEPRNDEQPHEYRKRAVVVEAVRWTGTNDDVMERWMGSRVAWNTVGEHDERIHIRTLEGVMTAQPGDWIIRGVEGEFYPCKPDIFASTYEPATPPPAAAPEGTPVERWLLEHERFTLEENENATRLGDIIERLCALLDEKEAEVKRQTREVGTFHEAMVHQRIRAEKAEADRDWLNERKGQLEEECSRALDDLQEAERRARSEARAYSEQTRCADELEQDRDQLKADLAAAREREAKLREAGHRLWLAWTLEWDCSCSPGHPLVHEAAGEFQTVLVETNEARAALAATKEAR